jgi:hypothetical protein
MPSDAWMVLRSDADWHIAVPSVQTEASALERLPPQTYRFKMWRQLRAMVLKPRHQDGHHP